MIIESHSGEFSVPNTDPSELLDRLGKWTVTEQRKHFGSGSATFTTDQLQNRTGALSRSIHYVTEPLAVDILPDYSIPYAVIHQTGGVTHPTVTERSKAFFWFKFGTTGEEKWKWMALQKVGTVMTVNIRPRPYMYFTDKDISYIKENASEWFVKAFTSKKEIIT